LEKSSTLILSLLLEAEPAACRLQPKDGTK
jgi:hypothetical protein